MERYGDQTEQNAIRYKNAVQELEDYNLGEGLVAQLTELDKEINTNDFWQHQSEGLCILISPEDIFLEQISFPIEQKVKIGTYYDLQPVISMQVSEFEFMILDFSETENRLIHCTQSSCEEVHITDDNWPDSIDAIQGVKERGSTLQMHVEGGSGVFHGHSKFKDLEKQDKFDYFRMMDDVLTSMRRYRDLPFVLSATQENLDLYLAQSNLPNFSEHHLEGSNSHKSVDELGEAAAELLDGERQEEIAAAISRLNDDTNPEHVTTDIGKITSMALQGRVEELIIKQGLTAEGNIKEVNGQKVADPRGEGENLANLALQFAINSGTKIHVYKPNMDFDLKHNVIAHLRW